MDNAKLLTEAQIEAINKVSEFIVDAINKIVEIIKAVAEYIKEAVRAFLESYHGKRVVHLALHHKDLRVRKKNRNRIVKWLRRYIKCRE
jgi:phosphopantothenate synthetase